MRESYFDGTAIGLFGNWMRDMDLNDFLKSKDFMKLGQAIEQGNWL